MKLKIKLLLMFLLMFSVTLFAQESVTDFPAVAPSDLIVWLTPILVLVGTWGARLLKPLIPGWAVLLIATGMTSLITFISQMALDVDASWLIQASLGMLAVVLNQFYKQFTATTT